MFHSAAESCRGSPKLQENFDNNGLVRPGQFGPANLIAKGWTFRVQSSLAVSRVSFMAFPISFRLKLVIGLLAAESAAGTIGIQYAERLPLNSPA